MNASSVNVVVGVVAYNSGPTIEHVLTAVRDGLTKSFGPTNGCIVFADGGSTDDTEARLRELSIESFMGMPPRAPADLLQLPYHGIPGKAHILQGILKAAKDMRAGACLVIDAGAPSVQPQWVQWLAEPVLAHGFDLVSPYFDRHPHDGALTKGIVYPLFRALYGVRLRQPASPEFACSPRLLERVLVEDLWDGEAAQVGIDQWLTASAAAGDLRIAEAALGMRRHHPRAEAAFDLGTTLTQVVGSLFIDLEQRVDRWQRVRGSVPVFRSGQAPAAQEVAHPNTDVEPLIEGFRLACRELNDLWTYVLPPMTIVSLRRAAALSPTRFRIDDELWARVVYDFALGHRLRVVARDHLLGSLVPLYRAWLASFILETRDVAPEQAAERIETLAATFEAQKPYLISRWRWPERLRT